MQHIIIWLCMLFWSPLAFSCNTWENADNNIIEKYKNGRLISLNFQELDVQEALYWIVKQSGLNLKVMFHPKVAGDVTAHLVNIPWHQAFDLVLEMNDLDVELDGDVLSVAPVKICRNEASDSFSNLSLSISKKGNDMIQLRFNNSSTNDVQLKIPVEGSGNCNRYFHVEAISKDGATIENSMLYALGREPFIVTLKPRGGLYLHYIYPDAYLNGVKLELLQKLRVIYKPINEKMFYL